jgi:hypothetical protein
MLPLSVARDLTAYEELVVELAKHLYRRKHIHRERLPKGFAAGFNISIQRIDDGSAKPALVATVIAAAGQLLPAEIPVEIFEARDLVNEVIAAENVQLLPASFPRDFFSYFNRIGLSLEDGDCIEWLPESAENKCVLTPAKRIRLALNHRENYEAEAMVVGTVKELDSEKRTGTLRTLEGGAVAFVFAEPFFQELKDALGVPRSFLKVRGVGVFDRKERLASLTAIEAVEAAPHHPVVSAVERLAEHKDGWLNGVGKAPTPELLTGLASDLARCFPDALAYPAVAPTEEGGVVMEWIHPGSRIELEIAPDGENFEIYATLGSGPSAFFVEKLFPRGGLSAALGEVEGLSLL